MIKPVSISEDALEAVKKIVKSKEIDPDYGLRIGTRKSSGCGGDTNFILGFDIKTEKDISYNTAGVTVLIKKSDVLFLTGIVLDYVTIKNETGFVFNHQDT